MRKIVRATCGLISELISGQVDAVLQTILSKKRNQRIGKSLNKKDIYQKRSNKKRSEFDGKREAECNESSETDECIFASESNRRGMQGARENVCRDVQGEEKTPECKRPRDYRVCHFGGRVGGHCYPGHYGISSENPRALGCDSRRYQRAVVLRLHARFAMRLRARFAMCLRALFVGRFVGAARLKNVSRETLCARFLGRLSSASGQGTVEYALVMAALLSIVIGLGALWRVFDAGILVEHALASASHHMQAVTPGAVADVFIY